MYPIIPTSNSLIKCYPNINDALKSVIEKYPYETHPAHSLAKKIQEEKFNLIDFFESITMDKKNNFSMESFFKRVKVTKGLSDSEQASIFGICSNCILFPNNHKSRDPFFWKHNEQEYIKELISKNIDKE